MIEREHISLTKSENFSTNDLVKPVFVAEVLPPNNGNVPSKINILSTNYIDERVVVRVHHLDGIKDPSSEPGLVTEDLSFSIPGEIQSSINYSPTEYENVLDYYLTPQSLIEVEEDFTYGMHKAQQESAIEEEEDFMYAKREIVRSVRDQELPFDEQELLYDTTITINGVRFTQLDAIPNGNVMVCFKSPWPDAPGVKVTSQWRYPRKGSPELKDSPTYKSFMYPSWKLADNDAELVLKDNIFFQSPNYELKLTVCETVENGRKMEVVIPSSYFYHVPQK